MNTSPKTSIRRWKVVNLHWVIGADNCSLLSFITLGPYSFVIVRIFAGPVQRFLFSTKRMRMRTECVKEVDLLWSLMICFYGNQSSNYLQMKSNFHDTVLDTWLVLYAFARIFFIYFFFLYCASLSGCEFKCIQNQVVIPNHIWLVYHRNFLSRHTTLSLLPRVDDSEVHEIQLFMKWKSFYFILFIWTFNCQALCIFLKMPLLCITPNIYFKKATFLTVLCSV